MKELPGHLQVAGQVSDVYHSIYADLNPDCRMIELDYESLCSDPREVMTRLESQLQSMGILRMPNHSDLPESFSVKSRFSFSEQELNEVETYFRNENIVELVPFKS